MKIMLLGAWISATALLPIGNRLEGSSARAAPAAPTCQNVQLAIQPYHSQGAAGHIAVIYRLHNLLGQPCTLVGYPGVQLLNRKFVSLPTKAHRGRGNLVGAIAKQVVPVGAHGNAYFALGHSDVPVNNQQCPTAYYLMIFPPNDVLPVVTYAFAHGGGIMACGGNINLSPVTARPRYQ